MRFLFITHSAAPSGAEQRLSRLVRGLAPHAAVVTMEEGPLVEQLRRQGTPVDVLPLAEAVRRVRREDGAAAAMGAVPQLAKLLPPLAALRSRSEITIAFSQKAFVAAALTQPFVRRPLVWSLNDIISGEHFSASMRKIGVVLANRAVRRVVVNSRASAEAFVAAGGAPDLPRVIHPGVDLQAFRRAAVSQPRPPSRLRVGSFGRLAPWKGQDVLLHAAAQVAGLELWIVGASQFGEEEYGAGLERLAEKLGVADRVRFFGHRDDVPALMAACDVVAHTSTAPEPFGQVIVEAMAAGKPIVATGAGGVLEIIEGEVNGLLVPPGNVGALAAALSRLARDPALGARLAMAGQDAAETFSTVAMVEAWSACLRSLRPRAAARGLPYGPGRLWGK